MSQPRSEKAEKPASKLEQDYQRFAVAFADPASLTYDDRAASMLAIRPTLTDRKTARDTAARWLRDPDCQAAIERVKMGVRIEGGLTAKTYIELCLERAQFYRDRGQKGDALADAKLIELAGRAAGFFVNVTKDITPPENRPQLTGGQLADALIESLQRLQRLRTPVPEIHPSPLREIAAASSREIVSPSPASVQ
jgi:hypothetical protein